MKPIMPAPVPRPYLPGLAVLQALSDEESESLYQALSRSASFKPFPHLREVVGLAIPAHADAAHDVVNALFGLRTQLRVRDEPVDEFVEAVAESLQIGPGESTERASFTRLLVGLLSCPAIVTSAAAAELTIQHERPFRAARIVSDIRPIFGDDVNEAPEGAVVLHSLTLSYWTPSGMRDAVEVVLDHGDLEELQEVVERAMIKAATLQRMLKSSGLTPFQIDEEST